MSRVSPWGNTLFLHIKIESVCEIVFSAETSNRFACSTYVSPLLNDISKRSFHRYLNLKMWMYQHTWLASHANNGIAHVRKR